MSSFFLLTWLTLWKLTSSQLGTPTNFVITTHSNFPGNNADELAATLYWQTGAVINTYKCNFTPTTTAGSYTCNSGYPWTGPTDTTSTALTSHYIKLEYSEPESDAIEIETITVTLDNTLTYTMETFCIHSKMSCTLGLTSIGTCGKFDSKAEYNTVKLGGDTQFKLLYMDWTYNVTGSPNFANIIHEGNVRPPMVEQIGITVEGNHDIAAASAKWDNVYYKCSGGIPTPAPTASYTCTVDTPKLCHGISSDFWISMLNPDTCSACGPAITHVRVIDETSKTYVFSTFCEQYSFPYVFTPNCTGGAMNHRISVPNVRLGDLYWDTFKAWIAPEYPTQQCIFAYPNVADPAVQIEVLNNGISEGWDDSSYGGSTLPFECPPTQSPTSYPTYQPTYMPTFMPTFQPTFQPTFMPTFQPTYMPTFQPTFQPTYIPTFQPTFLPTFLPTINPTINPTITPTETPTKVPSVPPTTGTPTKTPTKNPSTPPTKSPTNLPTEAPTSSEGEKKLVTKTNIFWAIIALAIFLLCCLICVIFIFMKRNKEDEEDENKAAPMVAAAALATYHKKEDTYGQYDAGVINTAPSMLDDDDDHYGGQYEAKESVELQEVKEEEIDKQYTLDGHGGATGGDTGAKGNEKVLDMLADGHETGDVVKKTDTELNPQETFAEFTV